jgi:hypothetical protein
MERSAEDRIECHSLTESAYMLFPFYKLKPSVEAG